MLRAVFERTPFVQPVFFFTDRPQGNPGRRSQMRGFVRQHDFPHLVAGVFPVALGQGAGGTSRAPIVMAAEGGMATSTLLTLFVVPVACSLIDDFMELLKHWRR